MKWRLRKNDVVEEAANAIYDALQRSINEHHETVREIRRELKADDRT